MLATLTRNTQFIGRQTLRTSFNSSFVRNFAEKMGLPRVFFDMAADGTPVGRIVIEVSVQESY